MHLILPKCTLFFRNAPDSRKNAPCFQKCTRLSKKCTPLFQKCTLKNQKCTRAFSLGAFFYQNRCTKPTERQGYVPTQIIEKREILTVRVSLSHFYPTLIRQLPSHFCFKTLLWVLAQGPPLLRKKRKRIATPNPSVTGACAGDTSPFRGGKAAQVHNNSSGRPMAAR